MRTSLPILGLALLLGCQSGESKTSTADKPAHHGEDGFVNPYLPDDFQPSTFKFLKAKWFGDMSWPDEPKNYRQFWQKADVATLSTPSVHAQATLIGHSSVLVQHLGVNVLTDPVFSERASPFSFAGPKRYTPTAVSLEELPHIDAVVISHNHYDHLDEQTVLALGNTPLWLVPLGLKAWFEDIGITHVVELDWWQTHTYKGVRFQALPSQHWSRRGLFDTNQSLWASWGLYWSDFNAWFGGDTGYNPYQFKEIGQRTGGFDLAMIPIGAYEPRWFMKPQHINPFDAVEIYKDIKAKQAFGIHWNTFVLTAEPVDEPPKALAQALGASKIAIDSL